MPRYLHIPHTPDTARTLTLSGRNCLVVSGMVTPPSNRLQARKRAPRRNVSARHAEVLQRGCCVPCRISVRPCAPHRAPCTWECPRCAPHCAPCTLECPRCAPHRAPCTWECPRCTPHRAPCTWESPRCTPHRAPCTWESPAMYPTENDILVSTQHPYNKVGLRPQNLTNSE